MPFPDIDPVALQIGPIAIRWYALAYITGLFGGWFYARRLAARADLWGTLKRPTALNIDDTVVAAAIGVVLGGRIGYVLFYNFGYYLQNPLDILFLWEGGMSFHGGFLGCALAVIVFARMRKLNPISLLDLCSTVAPIGLFFGRIANFINGELWGRIAPDFPYAVVFPHGGPLPRHPSQLYEAFAEGIVLFFILLWAVNKFGFRKPGLLGGIFLIGYSIARIACEFFRQPDVQLGFLFGSSVDFLEGGITMGMLLSLPMIVAGGLIVWLAAKGKTGSTGTEAERKASLS